MFSAVSFYWIFTRASFFFIELNFEVNSNFIKIPHKFTIPKEPFIWLVFNFDSVFYAMERSLEVVTCA